MKKLLELLEQKVQWIVLGLGVLWVLYMAWTFLIQPPVTVEGLAERPLAPGEVDDHINAKLVQDYENLRNRKGAAPPVAPEMLAQFEERLNLTKQSAETWPDFGKGFVWTTLPIKTELPPELKAPVVTNDQGPKKGPDWVPGQMERLPDAPAPKVTHVRNGMSYAQPVAANQGQPGAVGSVDKFWTTVRFGIDIAGIQKSFDEAKVPNLQPQALQTTILRAVVEREQLQPDGTWSNRVVVPPLAIQMMQAWPAENALIGELWGYLAWAQNHVVDILQPAFYLVVKGDPWAVPGEAIVEGPTPEQFDPTQFIEWTQQQIDAHVPPFTPQQKQQIHKARADKKKADAAGNRQTGPVGPRGGPPGRTPGRGAGGMGGPDFGPNDPVRPGGFTGPMPGRMGPDGEGGFGFPGEAAPGANVNFPLPPGEFSPQAWLAQNAANANITCWAHDDTVEPGQVYRYRVAYVIKNPVFAMPQFCKDPKFAEKFSVQTKFSDWSDKVEMLWTVSFWVKSGPKEKGVADVRFAVFRWQSGDTKMAQFQVGPGDPVGRKEGSTDYGTGWTLVDVVWDSKGWAVLVMDPAGNVIRRDNADPGDPRLKKMEDQAAASSASASALTP